MSKDACNELPPFNPDDPSTDGKWLTLCSPQDRLTYMTAKGVNDTAKATYLQATAAATLTCNQAIAKALSAFDNSQAAAVGAGVGLDVAVDVANLQKNAVSKVPDLDPAKVRGDPSLITAQSNAVKAAVANYNTAAAAVVTAQTPYTAALAALAKLSISVDPASPGCATISGDAKSIAEATCDIATTAATAARDKAESVFDGVRFQLWTRLNDMN